MDEKYLTRKPIPTNDRLRIFPEKFLREDEMMSLVGTMY